MNEQNEMSGVNQIMNNIKEEITGSEPSSARILNHLYDLNLRTRAEHQSLSASEYYDIVGETFKLNPEFFMNSIYGKRRLYINVNKNEMERYIIEKFCLYEGEKLLYECNGEIELGHQKMGPRASVYGSIYLTNYRIITTGRLSAKGTRSGPASLLLSVIFAPITKRVILTKGKARLIDTHQELPCYGYQFPIKNSIGLRKNRNSIIYSAIAGKIENMENASGNKKLKMLMKITRTIKITPVWTRLQSHRNKLFELICKDANQTVDTFRELHEIRSIGIKKLPPFLSVKKSSSFSSVKNEFIHRLRALWESEEYQHLSDSEYFDIVQQIYMLDPEFFMTSIYPKLMSWKFPSFLSVKKNIFEFISKERANIK